MVAVKAAAESEISTNTRLITETISTIAITRKVRRRIDVLSDTSNQRSSTRSEVRIRIKWLTREEVVIGEQGTRLSLPRKEISLREKKSRKESSTSGTIFTRKIRIDTEVAPQAKVAISGNAMDAGATRMARLPQRSLIRTSRSTGSKVVTLTLVSTN